MRAWGQVTDLVLYALAEIERGTYHDVADRTQADPEAVRKALHRMSREPVSKRRVYICDWTRDNHRQRAYPRPVYRLGSRPNVSKPKPIPHAASARSCAQRAVAMLSAIHPGIRQKAAMRKLAELRRRGAFLP
jgi:hypothetical protein